MEKGKELTIPKSVIELVEDESKWIERDALNGILNQSPPKAWIKEYAGFILKTSTKLIIRLKMRI